MSSKYRPILYLQLLCQKPSGILSHRLSFHQLCTSENSEKKCRFAYIDCRVVAPLSAGFANGSSETVLCYTQPIGLGRVLHRI